MTASDPKKPSAMDDYLFDLQGFLLLKQALSKDEVKHLNDCVDKIPPLKPQAWHGYIHRQDHHEKFGVNLQQIYEAGKPFETLIDHPSWTQYVRHYVGGEGTFDYNHGPLFIDENFFNKRGPGQAISLHSGGHEGTKRTQFRYYNGNFQCGQINILMALTDIGPGDGATMVIPGSHKANIKHPQFEESKYGEDSVDNIRGAVEVHMEAGDAILFVDAISHGSAERKNAGERRICVYRYGPSWGNFRFGYQPSPELLSRLTPAQRQIVQPLKLIPRPVSV